MLSPAIRKSVHVTQMSIHGIHQILGKIFTRLPEPNQANCNNLPLERVDNVIGTAVNNAVCLRDPTSNTSVCGIQSRRYQNGSVWAMGSLCVCPKSYKRRERRQWGPFIIENEMSFADYHSPGCSLSTQQPLKEQTKRTLKVPLPFIQSLWRNTIQVSLSFILGIGGMSFGQSLNWVATVDSKQSPSFKIIRVAMNVRDLPTNNDRQILLFSCYRRLKWCFANRRASITDVDEYGGSIVNYAALRYCVCYLYATKGPTADLISTSFSRRAKHVFWMKLYKSFVCLPL